jgi:hypothetical protein
MARGLAVEPVRRHLAEMMGAAATRHDLGGLPRVKGLCAAVDATSEGGVVGLDGSSGGGGTGGGATTTQLMYFLAAEDIGDLVVNFGDWDVEAAAAAAAAAVAGGSGSSAHPARQQFLSPDVFGCNSLGGPHRQVDLWFEAQGLVAPWRTVEVPVFSYLQALHWSSEQFPRGSNTNNNNNNNGRKVSTAVGILKVDVEGKDLAILRSVLRDCTAGKEKKAASRDDDELSGSCPLAIQFESSPSFDQQAELAAVVMGFESAGYSLVHQKEDDSYLSWQGVRGRKGGSSSPKEKEKNVVLATAEEGGSDDEVTLTPTRAYAWSAPLGLVVEGVASCGSAKLSSPRDGHRFAAGIPALVCLLNTGVSLPSLDFPIDYSSEG